MSNNYNELCELSCETKDAVCVFERSKFFTIVIIIGVLIAYKSIDLQENIFICNALGKDTSCCRDPLELRFSSSTLILTALVFFFGVSRMTADNCNDDCAIQSINDSDAFASTLVLAAGIVRYLNLFAACKAKDTQIEAIV